MFRPKSKFPSPNAMISSKFVKNIELAWDEGHAVGRRSRCGSCKWTIAMMLLSLVFSSCVVVTLVTWSIMYGVNARGFSNLSESRQTGQLDYLVMAVRLHLEGFVSDAMTVTEAVRVGLVSSFNSSVAKVPASLYQVRLYPTSKISFSNVFVGLPDGSFLGYGPLLGGLSFYCGVKDGDSPLYVRDVDHLGNCGNVVVSILDFNASQRPWYINAQHDRELRLSDVYSFSDGNSVGATVSVPIISSTDLGILNDDSVVAVIGVDIGLDEHSVFLESVRGANDPESITSWIFDERGVIVATSDPTIKVKTEDGMLLNVSDVDSVVIVKSMSVLLLHFHDFVNIPFVVSLEATIQGETYLISHAPFSPLNASHVRWHVAISQPKSIVYQSIWNANTLTLILIFVVMLPCVTFLSSVIAHQFLSVPIRVVAGKMDNVANAFEIDDSYRAHLSRIAEIRSIETSFVSMCTAIISFSKFAPVYMVKNLLKSKHEASLGVEEVDCTIFFSDIMSFTQISESVPPEILIATLATYLDEMARIIERNRGTFLDFVGDGIIAKFSGIEHKLNATRAGLFFQWRLFLITIFFPCCSI